MAYCEKFITGIKEINFNEAPALALRRVLLIAAFNELERLLKEKELLINELQQGDEEAQNNDELRAQIEAYKANQNEIISRLTTHKELINELLQEENPHLAALPDIDDNFIKLFSENFRNIRHLADTLSDAPPLIKAVQTQLYIKLLFQLSPQEQELQLQSLSATNLQDMVTQAITIYDEEANEQQKTQCQLLVQRGIYEIFRREGQTISAVENPDYQRYQEFLQNLKIKLPNVEGSAILDNLSEYKSSSGASINALLQDIEQKLKIKLDWKNPEHKPLFKEIKAFFHHLRFGQEDRRAYAKKMEKNITRDLFWARDIRDNELFTCSGLADEIYAKLSLQKDLEKNKKYAPHKFTPKQNKELKNYLKLVDRNNKLRAEEKRFAEAVSEVKGKIRELKESSNVYGNIWQSNTHRDLKKELLTEQLEEKFTQPTIEVSQSASGRRILKVELFYYDKSKGSIIENLDAKIFASGGYAANIDSMFSNIVKANAQKILPDIKGISLEGSSLEDIYTKFAKLRGLSLEEKESYKKQLGTLKEYTKGSEISALKLNDEEEKLLRQLLEVSLLFSSPGPNQQLPHLKINAIKTALTLFDTQREAINWKGAIKVPGLKEELEAVYASLGDLDPAVVPKDLKPLIETAKTLATSSQERLSQNSALKTSFAESNEKTQVEEIKKIFLEEYTALSSTLNLNDAEMLRLEDDISLMVEEVARLRTRTLKGEPALTASEEENYFSAIEQITQQLPPNTSIDQCHIKLQHGSHSAKITLANGASMQVDIQDLPPGGLPYSLIKPKEGEFIFSYGGSRGAYAPFEGLDEAYAGEGQKKRLFTHSRLLGVGQYGSVKEVEYLLTGLNQVIKKGYVPTEGNVFKSRARRDLRTRAMTAFEDLLYSIESDILQNLSVAENMANKAAIEKTSYWTEEDKERTEGRLFKKTSRPLQYHLLATLAKGETLADKANVELNKYSKIDAAYHNPLLRQDPEPAQETILLAKAIVEEAQKFEKLQFSHNDIKPENFLYKQNADGNYQVKYIDWATGGFIQVYTGDKSSLEAIFDEKFSTSDQRICGEHSCSDKQGRFVRREGNQISYGVNPQLQILHGNRNGTLPYISPKVLGPDRKGISLESSATESKYNTSLTAHEAYMDDWALTTLSFGICNRQAYFSIVKGRNIANYIVPGILEAEAESTELKIADAKKFNEFFACENSQITQAMVKNGEAYTDTTGVMFIPSNKQEGEPLHLYRRLQAIEKKLDKQEILPEENKIKTDIRAILNKVYGAVSSGEGLSKAELKEELTKAQKILEDYAKINDNSYQDLLQKATLFEDVITKLQQEEGIKPDSLLRNTTIPNTNYLKVLCTYPNQAQQEKAVEFLDKYLDEAQLSDKIINNPFNIFKEAIDADQTLIINTLLAKITRNHSNFSQLVREQGLLHYAAEKGMTDVAINIIKALKESGASSEEIMELAVAKYGPSGIKSAPYIKWSNTCFHIAIRNNDSKLLEVLLNQLPGEEEQYKDTVLEALHLCAVLSNKVLFKNILTAYNKLNLEKPINAQTILAINLPPERSSPYHLFMREPATLEAIDWQALTEDKALGRQFLIEAEANDFSPLLAAFRNGNFEGLESLLTLGKNIDLEAREWQSFFEKVDVEGKNVLNYILEQDPRRADFLIKKMKEVVTDEQLASILINLLRSPAPFNPLKNFLNNNQDTSQQFTILQELLDHICKDFSKHPKELQEARIIALLVNQDWLIAKANEGHELALRELLQNEALSLTYKAHLFEELMNSAPENSPAKRFYAELFAEVRPQILDLDYQKAQVDLNHLKIEVSHQNGAFTTFLHAVQETVADLKNEINNNKKSLDELETTLKEQNNSLEETRIALENSKNELAELVKTTESSLKEKEDFIKQLNHEVQDYKEKEQTLTIKQENLAQEIKELNLSLENKEKSLVKLEADNVASQASFQEKIQDLNKELTTSTNKLEDLQQEKLQLLQEKEKLIQENKEITTTYKAQEQELQDQVKDLGNILQEKERNIEENLIKISSYEAQEKELGDSISTLNANLEEKEKEINKLLQKIDGSQNTFEKSLSKYKRQLKLLSKENVELMDEKDEIRAKHAEKIASLYAQEKVFFKQQYDLEEKAEILKKDLADKLSIIERNQQEIENLNSNLENLGKANLQYLEQLKENKVDSKVLQELTAKIEEQQVLIKDKEKNIHSLSQQFEEVAVQNFNLQSKNQELITQNNALEETIVANTTIVKDLQKERLNQENAYTMLQDKQKLTEANLKETKKQLTELRFAKLDLEKLHANKEFVLKQSHQQDLQLANTGKKELELELNKYQTEKQTLEKKEKDLQQELSKLEHVIEQQNNNLEKKANTINEYEENISNLNKEFSEINQRLTQEIQHAKGLQDRLEVDLGSQTRALARAEAKIRQLETDGLKNQQTQEILNTELSALKRSYENVLEENSSLKEKIEKNTTQLKDITRELENSKEDLNALTTTLKKNEQQLTKKDKELEQTKQELIALEQNYSQQKRELEQSVSFKDSKLITKEKELEVLNQTYQKKREKLSGKIESLNETLVEKNQTIAANLAVLEEKQQEITQLSGNIQTIVEKNTTLEKELTQQKNLSLAEEKQLTSTIAIQKTELEKLQQGLMESQRTIQSQSKKLEKLPKLKTKLQDIESENESLYANTTKLNTDLARLKLDFTNLQQDFENQEKDLSKSDEKLQNSKNLIAENENRLKELAAFEEKYKAERDKSIKRKTKKLELQQKIERMIEEKDALLDKNKNLEKRIEREKSNREKVIANLEKELIELKSNNEKLITLLNNSTVLHQESTEALQEEINSQKAIIQEKEAHLRDAKTEQESLEQEGFELAEIITENKDQLKERENEYAQLNEQYQELKVQNNSINNEKILELQKLQAEIERLKQTNEELLNANKEVIGSKEEEARKYQNEISNLIESSVEKILSQIRTLDNREILENLAKGNLDDFLLPKNVIEKISEAQIINLQNAAGERLKELEARAEAVEEVENLGSEIEHAETVNNPEHSSSEGSEHAEYASSEEEIKELFEALLKSDDFDTLTEITKATNVADLDLLDLPVYPAMQKEQLPELQEIAVRRVSELKAYYQQQRETYKRGEPSCSRQLEGNKNRLKALNATHLDRLNQVDSKLADELKRLSVAAPVHWFNPAFQAAAKQNADKMYAHYQELGKGSKILVDYLKPLKIELKNQLASLPPDHEIKQLPNPQRGALQKQKKLLTRYLAKTENKLAVYDAINQRLHGMRIAPHPFLRGGILKLLDEAVNEKGDIKFLGYPNKIIDHPIAEKSSLFGRAWEPLIKPSALIINDSPATYKLVPAVEKGYIREHIINPHSPLVGHFIQEKKSSYPENLQALKPTSKTIVTKFPQGDDKDPAVIKARVEFAIGFVNQSLSEMKEPPSKKSIFKLTGDNPEELRYMWTALLLVGKTPGMEFNKDAIKVSLDLNTKKEDFKNPASCFQTCFKKHPRLNHLLLGIQDVARDKFGYKKPRSILEKSIGKVTTAFKTSLKETLQQLKKENNDDNAIVSTPLKMK